MRQAFQAVRRNRGAAGVDKVSINMFDANREENLAALMRDKSVQKFKAKVRGLTVRKHNLDSRAIEKLKRVIRGTANIFPQAFRLAVGSSRNLIRGPSCDYAA